MGHEQHPEAMSRQGSRTRSKEWALIIEAGRSEPDEKPTEGRDSFAEIDASGEAEGEGERATVQHLHP